MSETTMEKTALENALKQIQDYNAPFEDYGEVAKEAIKGLVDTWNDELVKTDARRLKRYFRIDQEKEKAKQNLDADELFSPMRLIDSNIKKEQAKYAAYLTKSARSVIAQCNEDSAVTGTALEKDFTTKARYNAWELPLLKWIDGTETHAWDSVEVVFDKSKPGHFAIEHVGHENLFFDDGSKDIQANDFILRTIEYTSRDLAKMVKTQGFNPIEIAKVLASKSEDKKDRSARAPGLDKFQMHTIEKVFFKGDDGFVYVGWSAHKHCDDWLREPRKLFLGQVDLDSNPMTGEVKVIQLFETSYPIELFVYSISEDECISKLMGRVDLDADKQDAVTSLMTSAITSFRRSSNLYWSVDSSQSDGTDIEECQTTIKLVPNTIFKKPLKQFQMQATDVSIFAAIAQLIGQSQQESGDVNYAVQSNKSTRKTSAEVKMAAKDNDLLSGVQVTLLSIALRNVYTRCFNIYSTRAIAGLVKVNQDVKDLITQYTWTLKPAGDVDVIERQQKLNMLMKAYPIYANSPAKDAYLELLTKVMLPDESTRILEGLKLGQAQLDTIKALVTAMTGIVLDENTKQIKPEFAAHGPQLMEILQQATLLAQAGNGSNPTATPAQASVEEPDNVVAMEA